MRAPIVLAPSDLGRWMQCAVVFDGESTVVIDVPIDPATPAGVAGSIGTSITTVLSPSKTTAHCIQRPRSDGASTIGARTWSSGAEPSPWRIAV